MVDFSVRDGVLEVRVLGPGKLWALKSRIRVPVACIRGVRHDPEAARKLWKGWRLPGTHIPGLITAGTYYRSGQKEFWDVRRTGRVWQGSSPDRETGRRTLDRAAHTSTRGRT